MELLEFAPTVFSWPRKNLGATGSGVITGAAGILLAALAARFNIDGIKGGELV